MLLQLYKTAYLVYIIAVHNCSYMLACSLLHKKQNNILSAVTISK